MNSSTLAHYGTKGQKWGIRRFQNEDGTLTEEGRRHYGVFASYKINRYAHLANRKGTSSEAKEKYLEQQRKEIVKSERRNKVGIAVFGAVTAVNVASIINTVSGGRAKAFVKNAAFKTLSSMANSKTAAKAAQWIKRHRFGGRVMSKKDYSIGFKALTGR
jgi:hypothetical protein